MKRPFNCHCHALRQAGSSYRTHSWCVTCRLGGGGHAPRRSAEPAGLGPLPWQGLPRAPVGWICCESPFLGRRQSHCLPSDKKCGLICFLFLRKCRAQGRCLPDRKSRAQGKGLAGPTLPTHTHVEDHRRPRAPPAPTRPSDGRGTQLGREDTCPRPPPTRQAARVWTRDPRPRPVGGQQPPCHPAARPANPG